MSLHFTCAIRPTDLALSEVMTCRSGSDAPTRNGRHSSMASRRSRARASNASERKSDTFSLKGVTAISRMPSQMISRGSRCASPNGSVVVNMPASGMRSWPPGNSASTSTAATAAKVAQDDMVSWTGSCCRPTILSGWITSHPTIGFARVTSLAPARSAGPHALAVSLGKSSLQIGEMGASFRRHSAETICPAHGTRSKRSSTGPSPKAPRRRTSPSMRRAGA